MSNKTGFVISIPGRFLNILDSFSKQNRSVFIEEILEDYLNLVEYVFPDGEIKPIQNIGISLSDELKERCKKLVSEKRVTFSRSELIRNAILHYILSLSDYVVSHNKEDPKYLKIPQKERSRNGISIKGLKEAGISFICPICDEFISGRNGIISSACIMENSIRGNITLIHKKCKKHYKSKVEKDE